MIRRPPRSTLSSSSAASDVYKREAGDLAGGGLAVEQALLRRPHHQRLGFLQRGLGGVLIAGGDRLLDLAHGTAHAAPPGLVLDGTADGLANGFLRRLSIGHF